MPIVNNVTRFLDSRKIKYTAYELPVEKIGALEAAQILQAPEAQVFKTIVTTREKGKPVLALISGNQSVDLKLLAAFLNEKKMSLPTQNEAEALTGLQAGGISPLALIHKGFQVVIDAHSENYVEIYISGGQRGLNIKIGVKDLIQLSHARVGKIAKESA